MVKEEKITCSARRKLFDLKCISHNWTDIPMSFLRSSLAMARTSSKVMRPFPILVDRSELRGAPEWVYAMRGKERNVSHYQNSTCVCVRPAGGMSGAGKRNLADKNNLFGVLSYRFEKNGSWFKLECNSTTRSVVRCCGCCCSCWFQNPDSRDLSFFLWCDDWCPLLRNFVTEIDTTAREDVLVDPNEFSHHFQDDRKDRPCHHESTDMINWSSTVQ